jgi:hypothetical protein
MEFRFSKLAACGFAAAALSTSMAAHANLVTNGGFETGDFSGWTTAVNGVFDGVDNAAPQAGTFAAFFGNPGASTISQTLATVAGSTYKVVFWLMAESDPTGVSTPNSFSFSWDGVAVQMLTDSPAFGYTEYQYLLAASSASTQILFGFSNTPAFWDFDSVSVTVPEPASLALALAALGGMLVARRRNAA